MVESCGLNELTTSTNRWQYFKQTSVATSSALVVPVLPWTRSVLSLVNVLSVLFSMSGHIVSVFFLYVYFN